MKKTILAMAVLAACMSTASAQTSVTIYGIVDAGIVRDDGEVAHAAVADRLDQHVAHAARCAGDGYLHLAHGLEVAGDCGSAADEGIGCGPGNVRDSDVATKPQREISKCQSGPSF